jgi:hypothetical protein
LVTWRGCCATSPGAIVQTLATRTSALERVGLKSGPLTPTPRSGDVAANFPPAVLALMVAPRSHEHAIQGLI